MISYIKYGIIFTNPNTVMIHELFLFWKFAMVEVMVTSLMDEFDQRMMKFFKRKELFVLAVCGTACLLGIPCVMQVQTAIHWMGCNQIITKLENPQSHLLLKSAFLSRWGSMFSS